MRAAALAGVKVPKLCAPTPQGVRLLPAVPGGDRRPQGLPRSCTTTVAAGMRSDQSEKLLQLRRADHLYISDHPLECAMPGGRTASCRTWRTASALPPAPTRAAPCTVHGDGREQSLLRLRPDAVHRVLALRARLRRGAGTFALTIQGAASSRRWRRARTSRPRIRVRLLRRVHRVLPTGR